MTPVVIGTPRVADVDVVANLMENHHIIVRVVVVRGPAKIHMSIEIVPFGPRRSLSCSPIQRQVQWCDLTGKILDIGLGVLCHIEDVERASHAAGDSLDWRGGEVYVSSWLVVRVCTGSEVVDGPSCGWSLSDGLVEQPLASL